MIASEAVCRAERGGVFRSIFVGTDTGLFRRPCDLGEIARTVDDPDHLNPVFHQSVKSEPAFDDERPCVFGDLRTSRAELSG